MAMERLILDRTQTEVRSVIHLDTKAVDGEGKPLPGTLEVQYWAWPPPQEYRSEQAYLDMIERESWLLAEERVRRARAAAKAEERIDLLKRPKKKGR